MSEFNLIDEKWIPCISLDGQLAENGVLDTLVNAHEIREVCDDSPLVTVALHRFLLAILYRSYGGPSNMNEWKTIYGKGQFDKGDNVGKYLMLWHSRFNLFDAVHPFMQVACLDLRKYNKNGTVKKENSDGLMRLAKEAPNKGGRILFDHRVATERPDYEPKQIARMVLSAQSYSGTGVASAGRVGEELIEPTPCQFAPCVDGLIVWLQGENLFHTLLLNLVPRRYDPEDKPAWEDDFIVQTAIKSWTKPIQFTGPVQRLVPLSRFIRVLDRKKIYFTNGLKTIADTEDPMKGYLRKNEKEAYDIMKLRKDKAAWRDSHVFLSLGSQVRKPPASMNHLARLVVEGTLASNAAPRANLVGLVTDKDKTLLWRHERMPLPQRILISDDLRGRLESLISEAETISLKLSRRIHLIVELVLDPSLVLRLQSGYSPIKNLNKSTTALAECLDPRYAYWARLEPHFMTLIEGLPDDWDHENNDWKPDEQQLVTNGWRGQLMIEARRALEESVHCLGTTARVIQAVAYVGTGFSQDDLLPERQNTKPIGAKKRGRKKK